MIQKLDIKSLKRFLLSQRFLMTLYAFIGIALFCFAVEYRKFCTLSSELLELREEYRVYTIALKKTIDEQAQSEDQAHADQKKKSSTARR